MAFVIKPLPRTRIGVGTEEHTADEVVDAAIRYADKDDDRGILEDFTVSRYATGIKKAATSDVLTDSSGGDVSGYDTYVMGDREAAIRLGNKFEIIPSGLFGRIADACADLFTHPKASWTYLLESGAPDDTYTEIITAHRAAGKWGDAVTRTDKISCEVNVCLLWEKWIAGHLSYEAVRSTDVKLMFPESVVDGDEDIETGSRGPVYSDLEDCLAVAIRLRSGTADGKQKTSWLAYIGRCETYPGGRCVTYEAEKWWPIPEFGSKSITDEWVDSNGEIGNPLTALQDDYPEQVEYEYPLIPFYGSDAGTDKRVLPTSVSLFNRCIELDSAGSRNITAANNAATGTTAVSDPENAGLPDTIVGPVALRGGQSIAQVGTTASNAKDAGVVIDGKSAEVAESEGIPAYTVLNTSRAPESAAALLIRNQPKRDRREKRIKHNLPGVEKMVAVERYLLALHAEVPLTDIALQWDPGEWTPPIPSAMLVEELAAAKTEGLIDQIEAIRRYHKFDTREQAKAYLSDVQTDQATFGTGVPSVDRAVKALTPRPRTLQREDGQDEGSEV